MTIERKIQIGRDLLFGASVHLNVRRIALFGLLAAAGSAGIANSATATARIVFSWESFVFHFPHARHGPKIVRRRIRIDENASFFVCFTAKITPPARKTYAVRQKKLGCGVTDF